VAAVIERGAPQVARKSGGLRKLARRRSTVAFLMALPLILLVAGLVVYPAFYSIYLSMLNKSLERFVGFSNFTFLFTRETLRVRVALLRRKPAQVTQRQREMRFRSDDLHGLSVDSRKRRAQHFVTLRHFAQTFFERAYV